MTTPPPSGARRPRDPRLDFFRGLAMFIILVAHVPANPWTLWIPARFGFSDATEIFVFCSGFASALAFGTVFAERGFGLGVARIAHRVWQVYWAHVGIFLVSLAFLAAAERWGFGAEGVDYLGRIAVARFVEDAGTGLLGLLTLSYVPGLFDILPMYLVILAMTPLVVAIRRAGGVGGAAAFCLALWLAATLAGLARTAPPGAEGPLIALGDRLSALNPPASPWGDATWFFNPFAWQIVFFGGFAFGARWLPAPPRDRRLALAAGAALVASLPFAWHGVYAAYWLPEGAPFAGWIGAARAAMEPLVWKTWQGVFRLLHFLALAYLAWLAVGPRGERIFEGWRTRPVAPRRRRRLGALGAALALVTAPYSWIEEIKAVAPALDALLLRIVPIIPDERIVVVKALHLLGLGLLLWNAAPEGARRWLLGEGWRRATPVIRKVGQQSLAVFMTSIPLAQLCGLLLDRLGRDALSVALVNLSGFAVLIMVAFFVSWIKAQPWRTPRASPAPERAARLAAAE